MKLAIPLAVIAMLVILLLPQASFARGLVPCGGAGEYECTPCHFAVLINNLTRFGIYNLAFPLAGLMFLYAGLLYAFSGGDEKRIGSARTTLKNTVLGLVIVLAAWFIVDTAIKAIVATPQKKNFISVAGPWNNPFENSICDPGGQIKPPEPEEKINPKWAIAEAATKVATIFGAIIMSLSVLTILLAALRIATAGGNEDAVSSSRDMIIYALVGVVVATLAFVIPRVVQQIF